MGTFVYNAEPISFDDRVLIHLQIVIVQKLRRGEGFTMTWTNTAESNYRRSSLWMHATIPVGFHFTGSKIPEINHSWLEELAHSASGSRGLIVTAEPKKSLESTESVREGVLVGASQGSLAAAGPHR